MPEKTAIMIKPYIAFLAFVILVFLAIPFSFDFATSVVPGWHTTIFPPYFVSGLIVVIVLLLVTIGYWLLLKRTSKTNWILFALHFALTVPSVMYLKVPSIFLDVQMSDLNELMKAIQFRIRLIPVAWLLFIIGQCLFLVYFIRTIKQGKRAST